MSGLNGHDDTLKLMPKPNDAELRIRMAGGEIGAVLEKYGVMLTVVEVKVDGKEFLRNIQILDKKPVTGVQINFAQGVPG